MSNVLTLDFSRDCSDSTTLAARKPSKTFKRHADRLKGKVALTKTEINALCWILNGVKAANVTAEERAELVDLLDSRDERPITAEQSKFGLEWLRKTCFKLNGETRLRCPLGNREVAILRNFKCFKWVGIYNTQEHYGNYGCKSYVPVWRTYDKRGHYFDYVVIAGGPGGGVELVIL